MEETFPSGAGTEVSAHGQEAHSHDGEGVTSFPQETYLFAQPRGTDPSSEMEEKLLPALPSAVGEACAKKMSQGCVEEVGCCQASLEWEEVHLSFLGG